MLFQNNANLPAQPGQGPKPTQQPKPGSPKPIPGKNAPTGTKPTNTVQPPVK